MEGKVKNRCLQKFRLCALDDSASSPLQCQQSYGVQVLTCIHHSGFLDFKHLTSYLDTPRCIGLDATQAPVYLPMQLSSAQLVVGKSCVSLFPVTFSLLHHVVAQSVMHFNLQMRSGSSTNGLGKERFVLARD